MKLMSCGKDLTKRKGKNKHFTCCPRPSGDSFLKNSFQPNLSPILQQQTPITENKNKQN